MRSPVAAHLADEVVDERRLERHLGDDLLDRLAVDADPSGARAARDGRGPALVGERLLEANDLALQTPDAGEGQLAPVGSPCGSSSPPSARTITSSAGISPRRRRSPTSSSARTAIGIPARARRSAICPTSMRRPICDFLLGGEQRDLADLLQIQTDRVLTLRRQRREGFLGDRRQLLGLFLGEDRRFRLLRGERGRHHAVGSISRVVSLNVIVSPSPISCL